MSLHLFFGKTWTGKTHLMRKILENVQSQGGRTKYLYVREFVEKLLGGEQENFKEYDAIAFDNIEDLKDKPATQRTLIDLLHKLVNQKKTVLMSSTGGKEDIPIEIHNFIQARLAIDGLIIQID